MTDEPNNAIDQQGEPGNELSGQAAVEQADGSAPVRDEAAPAPTQAEEAKPAEAPPEMPEGAESVEPQPAEETDETPVVEPAETPAQEDAAPAEAETLAAEAEPSNEVETPAEEAEAPTEEAPEDKKDWYILKVQSNREDSIREGLLRRVKIAGLEEFFGDVIVPTEKITEVKAGKKRVTKRKLYPGYIVVNMEVNDDTWFLVRETSGIGDFTGAAGNPTPMAPHEVAKIVAKEEEKAEKSPSLKIAFNPGDRVKIVDGNFENFEGDVENIDQTSGRVTVMINIFNRSTPVTLEYWQIDGV